MQKLWKKTWIKVIVIVILLLTVLLSTLLYTGIIWIGNDLSDRFYPIRGVDVSHYQGDIDWNTLEDEQIYFAFIKATEGSSTQDECFQYNWKEAHDTNLKIGAYHFFSFDSKGDTQAENYINTVTNEEGAMPPVVDIEFYGDKEINRPDKEDVETELSILLQKLEEHYGKKPIIYTTYTAYTAYIKDDFSDYPLWIRNTYFKPSVIIGDSWTFWQYSDEGKMSGYVGDEEYIDLNVYNGTKEKFIGEFCE